MIRHVESTWIEFAVSGEVDEQKLPFELLSSVATRMTVGPGPDVQVKPGKGCAAGFGVRTEADRHISVVVTHPEHGPAGVEYTLGFWEGELVWWSRLFRRQPRTALSLPEVSDAVTKSLESNRRITVKTSRILRSERGVAASK